MWRPDYALLADVKDFLRVDDDVDDTHISRAITAASRAVDRHCRRQFGKVDTPEARTYAGWRDDRAVIVPVDDLMTLQDAVITVDGTGVEPVNWLPRNAPTAWGEPYTRVVLPVATAVEVEIEALWGWSDIPVAVVEATILQASRLVKRRDSPFGVAGSPDLGSELRLLAKVDPDVAVTLGDYVRRSGVA